MNEKELLAKAFKKLIDQTYLIWCDYCIHNIPCGEGICPHYEEERSVLKYEGRVINPNYLWTCQDMNWEDCPGRKNTMCGSCGNGDNFEIDYEKLCAFVEED